MGQLANEVESILKNNEAKKEIKSERKKVLEQIAANEQSKANLVKKALASQRAAFGASGMTGKGMTEEAVLKRLREETETPFNEKHASFLEKYSKLKTPKKNLLKSFLSQFDSLLA
jgi:tRNA pseudouridine-54 N-methylase